MADCFAGVPIFSHDQQRQTLEWLRGRYGDSPQFTGTDVVVQRVWEQSAAMSCGVRILDEDGDPIAGYPVIIGWFDHSQPAWTNGDGWIDVPLNGAQYAPPNKGGFFIKAADGSWSYTGIGWRIGTNHDHCNLDLQRGGSVVIPPVVPPPGNPYVGMNRQDVLALRALMVVSRDKADEGIRLIDRVLSGEP